MTLYGVKKMIYADVSWATKLQLLHSFFVSKMDQRASEASASEREPLALVVNKSPAVFIFMLEIDHKEKIDQRSLKKK